MTNRTKSAASMVSCLCASAGLDKIVNTGRWESGGDAKASGNSLSRKRIPKMTGCREAARHLCLVSCIFYALDTGEQEFEMEPRVTLPSTGGFFKGMSCFLGTVLRHDKCK